MFFWSGRIGEPTIKIYFFTFWAKKTCPSCHDDDAADGDGERYYAGDGDVDAGGSDGDGDCSKSDGDGGEAEVVGWGRHWAVTK